MAIAMAGLRMQSLGGTFVSFADRSHERFYAVRVWCGKKEDRIAGKLAKVGKLVDAQRSLVLSSRIDSVQIDPNGSQFLLDRIMRNLEELQAEVASLNAKAGKKKKKKGALSSSSSSSSECGDVGEAMDMRMRAALPVANSIEVETHAAIALPSLDDAQDEEPAIVAEIRALCTTANSATTREIYRRGPIELKETSSGRVVVDASPPSPVPMDISTGGTIEVCTVGKCKRGGSQEILVALQGCNIPDVQVTSCKCMGKCRSAPNVRVRNGQGETQVHSHVSGDDVDALLEMHFGVQRMPMSAIAAA